MGFLLSKLLPLLVYPLGLGLLLQLAGLGSGRKAKLSRALGASGIAMVWLFAMPVTSRQLIWVCLLYTSPSPRDGLLSRMPSSA